ncbi:kinase-like domain-containing protein [Suillus subaureus]|uniref:Kinase-like domain-containing protein n=1 Tax=Suillus subaureus TaxID=48587 RepID=A0A9P7E6L2_9AGAM|nr:kinase-like domain-containing protein [Suillus subaureus]KAG1812195.1 kinase-like domain-containing protein [Suillus subaureus]
MPKVKCVHCGVVLERYEMPHHVRELHNKPLQLGQSNRNAPEMLFGEWQARESTQPASVITRPERETFQLEIQDILRQACSEGVETLPVLGALYAYTFTHLQLCAPEKQRIGVVFLNHLIADLEDLKTWLIGEGDAYLSSLKTMKDGLVRILQMSQVEKHICNTGLINEKKLHHLDINNIGALIVEHTTSSERARAFYADDNAQFMVEILQNLLTTRSEILEKYRRYLVNAVFKLSRKSGRFPQSLQLCGIQDLKHTEFHGGFGLIYQGQLNGRLVAVKKVLEGKRSQEQFHKAFSNEAVTWYYVRHANCLPFYGVYVLNDAEKTWCLVSPWMADGHVNHYLKEHPDADRYPLILDVARGLGYLHSMEPAVSHGDLKGDNILITSSGRACIADFGIVTARDSRIQMTTTASGVVGTLHFMAPELLAAESAADIQNLDRRRCDMYALACVCYEMFTGMRPFKNRDPKPSILGGQRPERPHEAHQMLDDFMWSLIETLWKHRPKERPTAEQVCERISHRMDSEGKITEHPSTEVEWDVGFLADPAVTMVTEDPFALAIAHTY